MDIITGLGGYILAAGAGLILRPFMDRIIKSQLRKLAQKGILAVRDIKSEALRKDVLNFLLTLSDGMLDKDFQSKAMAYKETFKALIAGKYDDFLIDAIWDSVLSELPDLVDELKKMKEVK